ncbi:MAG: sigma-54-dependent Fis family transcriptional regulator [Acidobacteria bacterium]|nr:MAG: sigma-54-dependent Fis family transcriptional regulator [Acidobacteriota bacterium]
MSFAKVLIVEDEELMRVILEELLKGEGYEVFTAEDGESAIEIFSVEDIDLIVTDIRMQGMDGLELLDKLKSIDENALVIIITAYSSVDSAIAALRKGAYDYITKPFVNEELLKTIRNALRQRELFRENRYLRRELNKHYSFSEIIGTSESLQNVFRLVEKISATNSTVLIQGESGTGKELIARAIHHNSLRADKPFIAVNCGALPETLLESELFGYVRGAFTDAKSDRKGLFRSAEGGTIFLDEVSEMPPSLQVKLLRALQEHEVTPVGSNIPIKFDARIIAATNKNLEDEVKSGRFREDLFYRLNVIEINLPPLRERKEDIPLLARHFIKKLSKQQGIPEKKIPRDVMLALTAYNWPGNVRELENAIERAFILSQSEQVELDCLPAKIVDYSKNSMEIRDPLGYRPTLEEMERRYIFEVLRSTNYDKAEAAQILGIDLSTLYRKLKRYGHD